MKNITYRQIGDYLIPNIKLAEEDKQPIGKYGLIRKDYLYNSKRVYFNIMLMNGELIMNAILEASRFKYHSLLGNQF